MAVWLVRAGKNGAQEDFALENGLAVIGWDDIPDISAVTDREQIRQLMQNTYPDKDNFAIGNWTGQVWSFLNRSQEGDRVVLPLKTRGTIAIGKFTGPYKYFADNPDGAHHTRQVKWVREDIPRDVFGQDLLSSLNSALAVCQIKRNNAEQRIAAILDGKPDPMAPSDEEAREEPSDMTSAPDLEQNAADQIRTYIAANFKAHGFAHLVGQVLKAQGYHIHVSPPGPDGGVDILAGRGAMGFDEPRLCVQVKSTGAAVDVKVFRELRGVMEDRGADQGLLVSWSGFTGPAIKEARRQFFRMRLWDADTFVEKLLDNYDKLDEELRAELPLKRIWVLVPEDE